MASERGAHFWGFYLQLGKKLLELHKFLAVKIEEKSPHACGKEKGKVALYKICLMILLFLARSDLKGNYFSSV